MSDPYAKKKRGLRKEAPVEDRKQETPVVDPNAPRLRKKTIEGIKAFNAALVEYNKAEPVEEEEVELDLTEEEEQAREMLGDLITDKTETGEVETKVALDTLPEKYQRVFYRGSVMDNPETRKSIANKSSDLDISDLIMVGRVKQHRPILSGKLEVLFQSLTAADSMWVEDQAVLRFPEDQVAQRIWAGNARMVLGCLAINNDEYPSVHEGKAISADAFEAKFERIYSSSSENVIDIIMTNWNWFCDDVALLLENDFEQLKNG